MLVTSKEFEFILFYKYNQSWKNKILKGFFIVIPFRLIPHDKYTLNSIQTMDEK